MHHLRFGSLFVALYNIIMNSIVTAVLHWHWQASRKGQKNRPIARYRGRRRTRRYIVVDVDKGAAVQATDLAGDRVGTHLIQGVDIAKKDNGFGCRK